MKKNTYTHPCDIHVYIYTYIVYTHRYHESTLIIKGLENKVLVILTAYSARWSRNQKESQWGQYSFGFVL